MSEKRSPYVTVTKFDIGREVVLSSDYEELKRQLEVEKGRHVNMLALKNEADARWFKVTYKLTKDNGALTRQLTEAKQDTDRLTWYLEHEFIRVLGGGHGWRVYDQSDGLTVAGKGKTAREAIDDAMKKGKKGKKGKK